LYKNFVIRISFHCRITVYPPPPAKGGIAINTEDYLCLAEDQFLNDVIIDFYLKYLTLEVLSESDQQRTHVFSSYFYKRLTSPHAQAAESTVPMTPAAKRHARVQKWTKNVNIFEKDFIIIPINEQ
jgi:sentrin-specific protease 7